MSAAKNFLAKARTKLLLDSPFFGVLALKLRVAEGQTQTMATNGTYLWYNPIWVAALPFLQLLGVVAHEIMHCALLHMYRRGDRDPRKWNVACDYAINWILVHDFGFQLPPGALISEEYSKKSAEEIYSLLPDDPEGPCGPGELGLVPTEKGDGPGCYNVPWGEFTDPQDSKDTSQPSIPEQIQDWQIAQRQALQAEKAAGNIAGNLLEQLGLGEAKVDWVTQLSNVVGSIAKTDFNWYPPEQLYLSLGLHVPTLNAPSIGHLTYAIDSSGSMDIQALNDCNAELNMLLENVHFEGVTVIQCDTRLQGEPLEFEPEETVEFTAIGRGGTCFKPVFDYVKKHPTDALIYFTDMEPWDWNEIEQPECPVYWARTANITAPFGEYIDVYRRN
jgi:predicted metal-dependent peptidase